MGIEPLLKCLEDLYQEGYNNGMCYASHLEFSNGKSALSIEKEKQREIQTALSNSIIFFQDYLNELLERIVPVKTEYSRGVEMSYAALIRQLQIWKDNMGARS